MNRDDVIRMAGDAGVWTPMGSEREMDMAGSDHCDGYLSKAQAVWDAMIAVAPNERSEYPEAKP